MPERVLRLGIDPSGAVQGGQKFDRAADSAAAAALGLNKAVLRGAAGVAAVGTALVAASAALGRFAQAGGRNLTVLTSFDRRVGDASAALGSMTAATRGLVSQQELMVQFNRSVTLGASENVAQFNELSEAALALGRALGVDAAFALESLSLGIGRQSRLILDNLGLIVSVEEANRKYAEAIGTTADELTDAQKREAFRAAALDQARAKVDELGGVSLNAGDAFTELTTEIRNTIDAVGVMVAQSSAVENFFSGWASAIVQTRVALGRLVERQKEARQQGFFGTDAASRAMFGGGGFGTTDLSMRMLESGPIRDFEPADIDSAADAAEGVSEAARELAAELDLLTFRLDILGEQVPRTLSAFEIQTGLRPAERRSIGTGDFGRGFRGADPLVGIDRSQPARDFLAKQTTETAESLKQLSREAFDAGSAFDDLGESLASRFDPTQILSSAAGNLLSSGISFGIGQIGEALFGGDSYVSALEENTRALRRLSEAFGPELREAYSEERLQGLPPSIRERIRDAIGETEFGGALDIARRRLDATDAEPGDEFDAIRDVLAGGLSGPLAGQVAGLTTENVDEFLQRVLDQIEAGTLDPEDLGSVSLTQFLDLLAEMENLGDAAEAAADEFDALTKSIQALNSPSGLNLALLGYRAGLDGYGRDSGGGRRGDPGSGDRRRGGGTRGPLDGDTPRRRTDGGGSDRETDGVGGRRETVVTINVNGAEDPVVVADEVVRIFEREAARGGPATLDTSTRLRR